MRVRGVAPRCPGFGKGGKLREEEPQLHRQKPLFAASAAGRTSVSQRGMSIARERSFDASSWFDEEGFGREDDANRSRTSRPGTRGSRRHQFVWSARNALLTFHVMNAWTFSASHVIIVSTAAAQKRITQ